MASIAEILSSVGKPGERIYSVPWGYVNVASVDEDNKQIKLDCGNGNVCWLDGDGRLTSEGECVIWPSYDQRDWEAWGKERAAAPSLEIGDYVSYGGMQWFVDVIECTGRVELKSVVGCKGVIIYRTTRDEIAKADKFDPSALQPFDKVIARYVSTDRWRPDFWGYMSPDDIFCCTAGMVTQIVPYNDLTKHLIGTTDDAPEFYRL
jgi:hypothetical protein